MKSDLLLGLKIKKYRERAGLSQMELAHRVGKNDAAWVSRIESGRISPKKVSLKNIASALDLSEVESLGAVTFAKDHEDDFVFETPVLQAFSEQISIAIENAKKFETLKKNLEA